MVIGQRDPQRGGAAKSYLHDMAKSSQSSSIHVTILDFAKAFDKVLHR